VDPLSIALGAFSAIKAGAEAGKGISSMAGDIGKLFDAIDDCRDQHSKKKNSVVNQFVSPNEEAMQTFIAKQQAKDLEAQLRELIVQTRGLSAWSELLRLRAEIRARRKEEERERARKARERLDLIYLGGGVFFLMSCLVALVAFILYTV
tara:strand:- start:3425 stop:3874 length:450 start_codon:yes stop_codon:yes gene_type:complete